MAEQVQATLDTMVAPLRDLLDRGIFSDDEIKAIVSRRRASEYLLRRRAARKADFLRYIEDEIKLEQLRFIRTRKLNQGKDSDTPKSQLPIGDIHIVQNIHLLFVRALRKFRGDVRLHLQHAEFAKSSRSYNRVSAIYTQALQVHPRHVPLWIEAASYEFFGHEHNGNIFGGGSIQTARVLLQRALRINTMSQDLWWQYFTLEWHHVQKLKGRREILNMTATEEQVDNVATIPRVVYQNAIKAIPTDVAFRCKFLDICQLFPQTEPMQEEINASMERDFSKIPEAWVSRAAYTAEHASTDNEQRVAKRLKTTGEISDPVLVLLQEGLKEIPTSDMACQCLVFVRAYGSTLGDKTQVQSFVDHVFVTCRKKGIQSSELVLEQASWLTMQDKDAVPLLKECCSQERSLAVWVRWAQLVEDPSLILRQALKSTPMDTNDYMVLLLELLGVLLQRKDEPTQIKTTFEQILLLAPGRIIDFSPAFGVESVASACLQYLRHANDIGGLEQAREVIDHVLLRSNYCESSGTKTEADLSFLMEFFDKCTKLEKANHSKRTKDQLRRLYGAAIRLFEECSPTTAEFFRKKLNEDVRFAR